MTTIFVRVRQVTSEGILLENVLEPEFKDFSAEYVRNYWTSHEGYPSVKIEHSKLIECPVVAGTIYLPTAKYPNWSKQQYIPQHWNVSNIK